MTEEEQALETKRVKQGRQRTGANTLMSVGTTLAMTATQGSGLGYVAAGAVVVGAVVRENLINEHAKEADDGGGDGDRTEKVDGRPTRVRLADVGCALAPAVAPLIKGAPGALVVGALVEVISTKEACNSSTMVISDDFDCAPFEECDIHCLTYRHDNPHCS